MSTFVIGIIASNARLAARTEHLRIVPVFGPNAVDVSPRIGHIHVTVDDSPWRCADASGEPLIIN